MWQAGQTYISFAKTAILKTQNRRYLLVKTLQPLINIV